MIDALIKAVFYVTTGVVLGFVCVWYARSLYETITGRGEVVIAPFEIVGIDGDTAKARGVALAHMLQARLREVERDVNSAQKDLMATGTPAPQAGVNTPFTVPAPVGGAALPGLLTERVSLKTALLEPTDIKVSVAGVEVGGLLATLQRKLANSKTLQFTLYEKKSGSQVTGSLKPLDLADDSMRIEVPLPDGDDTVTLDRVADQAAYEVIRRRLAESSANKVEVLSGSEFQSLVEVLREAARLNRRLALGRGALPEFQELLPKVKKLATDVPEWYQLNYLAASIAESAKDPRAAVELYQLAKVAAERSGAKTAIAGAIQLKLEELRTQIALLEQAPADSAATPEHRRAKEVIERYVRAATSYLNQLLGQNLQSPPVKLQTDQSLRLFPYWDGTSVVVADEVQYLPDMVYRQASWPQILSITGSSVIDSGESPAAAIVYSYADVFTMLVHQNEHHQDEKTSDWLLAPGAQEFWEGQDISKVKAGRPYLSFKALAAGKVEPSFQASHMRDYARTSPENRLQYINSGIFNHAFYQASMRVGTARAADIWVAALRKLKLMRKVDFPRFARQIYEVSGEEREQIRLALVEVGLDPAKTLAEAR